MTNKSVERIKKEAQKEATRENVDLLKSLPKYSFPDPAAQKFDEKTGQQIIQAKDAEIGKDYLSVGFYYKVTVLKKHGDENYTSSVLIQAEGSFLPISVAGSTELISYQEQFHIKKAEISHMSKKEANLTPQRKAAKKEKTVKMSSIITPMLLEGTYTAVQIADAVIEKLPDRASEKDKLITWIGKGYIKYLEKNPKLCGGKKPFVKASVNGKGKKDKAEKKSKKTTLGSSPETLPELPTSDPSSKVEETTN